jgi:hypothetical protein
MYRNLFRHGGHHGWRHISHELQAKLCVVNGQTPGAVPVPHHENGTSKPFYGLRRTAEGIAVNPAAASSTDPLTVTANALKGDHPKLVRGLQRKDQLLEATGAHVPCAVAAYEDKQRCPLENESTIRVSIRMRNPSLCH